MVKSELFCQVMAEVPNQHRLHPTSISYVNKGVEQIAMLWMGIWVHPYMRLHINTDCNPHPHPM
jgi:hypothetical protein